VPEVYDDKLGYTNDGFVWVAQKKGMGCITPEQATELADELCLGNETQRWYAQELRNAAAQAFKIRKEIVEPKLIEVVK
jgi:hypothetical protein